MTVAGREDAALELASELEPILAEARALHSPTWRDYERLKSKVSNAVGWDAAQGSSVAYEAGIAAVVEELGL